MNKKFSTLVAALLASGGLFYAVDAMILPAGDGVAKTFVAVATSESTAATTEVVACNFKIAADFAKAWKVKQVGGKYYLEVKDAPGWILCEGAIQKINATTDSDYTAQRAIAVTLQSETDKLLSGSKEVLIDATTGAVSLAAAGEGNAYLYTASDTRVSVLAGNTEVALSTEKTVQEVGDNDAKWSAGTEVPGTVNAVASISTATNMWELEAGADGFVGNFYLKKGSAYLKSDGTNLSLVSACPNDALSAVTVGGSNSSVMIGGKFLSCAGSLGLVDGEDSNAGFYLVAGITANTPVDVKDAAEVGEVYVISMLQSSVAAGAADWSELAENAAVQPAVPEITVSTPGISVAEAEKWTAVVGGDLKLMAGDLYLQAPSSPGSAVLVAEDGQATAITLDGTDGALKSGSSYLVNNSGLETTDGGSGTKLYLFTEAGVLVSSQDEIVNGENYLIAEKNATTTADKTVDVELTIADLSEPGSSVEGMKEAGVYVKDGEITLIDPEASTRVIPAPFTITSADAGLKELAGKSWTLVNGKMIDLAAEKAGEAKKYLGKFTTKAADPKYVLVEESKAIEGITYSQNGLTIEGVNIAATLKTTGEAPALVVEGQLKSVNAGDIVTISDGQNSVNDQWKIVLGTLSNDNISYSFVKCDIHGKEVSPKTYLTVDGETDFIGKKYNGSFSLQTKDGSYLEINGGTLAKAVQGQPSLTLFAYDVQADAKPFNVNQLLNDFGSRVSFGVALKHKYTDEDGDAATKAITTGNVFADADLVPVKYVSNPTDGKNFVELTGDKNSNESAFLLKSGDRYIVLETTKDSEWTSIKTDLKNGGYKFTTVSEKAMLEILTNSGEFNKGTYAPYFTFNYDNATNEGGKGKAVYSIEVKDYSKTSLTTALYISSFEVKTGAQKGVYLTVTNDKAYWVAADLGLNNLVKAKSDNSPLNYTYVNIEFANHPSIKDKNGKVLNGRVPSADVKETADKSEMLFNKPEGQWIVNVDGQSGELNKKGVAGLKDATSFTFVNRESNESFTVNAMYYLGDNKYAVSSSSLFAAGATRDTMIITGVKDLKAGTLQRDGYADLKASDVQDELFRLLVASTEEDYYVGENHTAKSHFLGLSHNEEAAVNWRIVPLTGAREFDKDGFLKTASDSIYELRYPQYFKDDKLFSKNDTIAIIGYALQNTANDEYLTYENPQTTTTLSMICDPNFKSFKTTKEVSKAYRFVLKEKATDLYNIVGVNGGATYDKDGYPTEANANPFTLGSQKLYGATTLTKQGAVEVEKIYEKINSNDLFKVQKLGAPEYRLQSMGDTIRIFRQENDYDQMYENGEFLNLGNKAQLTTMAPALYVDTAYVKRGNNNRYQYLLVVNPEYKAAVYDNANHLLKPDTMYGRFLVNLVDTANVAYQNGAIHANKYINDTEAGETYAKLGFVYGFRTADKLYITDKNYKKSAKASDVIDLGTSDFNTAKFAFRYIDPINHEADGSFKIQTGYYDYNAYIAKNKQPEVANNGYLKNINGVVVVANGYEAGDKFDLAAEHSNPTANEGINASEVSVIAKEGEVVINGAAGKTVVITNVLGQTIASTVLSSDNATISAPAGVVVVAVEGEAAVKAIVK